MTKSKWWKSDIAQQIGVIAAIVTILAGALSALQFIGTIDIWTPISSFFELTVPMSFFIFASLLFFCFISIFALFPDYFISKPLEGAELLRYGCVRYIAILCRSPQTPDYVKEQYAQYYQRNTKAKFPNSQSCLQAMEEKGLLRYDAEKGYWLTTRKSLDYLTKFYGYHLKRKNPDQ